MKLFLLSRGNVKSFSQPRVVPAGFLSGRKRFHWEGRQALRRPRVQTQGKKKSENRKTKIKIIALCVKARLVFVYLSVKIEMKPQSTEIVKWTEIQARAWLCILTAPNKSGIVRNRFHLRISENQLVDCRQLIFFFFPFFFFFFFFLCCFSMLSRQALTSNLKSCQ